MIVLCKILEYTKAMLVTADERFVKKIGKSDHLSLLKSIDV